MASDVLSQTFFGVYEFFANIIPGTLIVVTILFMVDFSISLPSNAILEESLFLVILAFVAFVAGLAVQGISALMEKYINKKRYGDYPSSLYLREEDKTFPSYFKVNIRKLVNKKFGTPIDASPNHIFDLCFTYVMQKKISERVPQFLRTYTFSRNMIVTMIIEAVFFFYLAYSQQQLWFVIAGLGFVSLSYIFYTRFLRYGESFAKEVFRSFFVNEATTKTSLQSHF
jgi:hypothetical protein